MGLTSVTLTIWSVMFWAGALHGLYLAVVFALRKEDQRANRLFALLLFLFSFHLTNYLLFITGLIKQLPHFLSVQRPLLYLIGPAIFFYVRAQLGKPVRGLGLITLHLVPAIFVFLSKVQVYLQSSQAKLEIIQGYFSGLRQPTLTEELVSLAYLFHILFYLVLSLFALVTDERLQIRRKPINHRLWKTMLVAYGTILVLTLTFFLSAHALSINSPNVELTLVLMLAVSIHVLGYIALKRPSKLRNHERGATGKKYVTSPLTSDALKRYEQELLKLMQSDKPFLKADLSVADLAAQMNIPRHHLSQLLNQERRTNFYDFVNEYRVEEAKLRLKDPTYSNYKISAIAADVGFQNKISFNRTFKRKTGVTPSQYRDE